MASNLLIIMKYSTKALYISATGRNVGKTFVSLGLLTNLSQHFNRIGYMKPIGHRYVETDIGNISEDALLVKDITEAVGELADMSPVIIEPGLTQDFIAGRVCGPFMSKIVESYKRIANHSDLVIIEGSGHAGVGSVLDTSNADIAKTLAADVILVVDGGLGRTIDLVMLNKTLFEVQGCRVIGVVANKILAEKYEKITKALRQGLHRKGIKLLGAIPYQTFLSSPTLGYLADELHAEVILAGETIHKPLENVIIADSDVSNFLKNIVNTTVNTLAIIDSSRIDLLLAAAATSFAHQSNHLSFIIADSVSLSSEVQEILKETPVSILGVKQTTYELTKRLHDLTVKLVETDKQRLDGAVELVGKYVSSDRVKDEIFSIKGRPSSRKRYWLRIQWLAGSLATVVKRIFHQIGKLFFYKFRHKE